MLYLIPLKFHNKVYPFFTIIETLLYSSFFYSIIKNKRSKKLVVISAIVFSATLIIYYYYSFFVSRHRIVLDSVPIGIETILMFIFSFIYFYEQLKDTTTLFIYNKPSFWGVLGILLCLSGSFFIYIFANQISFKELSKYWIITNIAVTIRNLFFAIAIYLNANQSVKKSSKDYNLYTTH